MESDNLGVIIFLNSLETEFRCDVFSAFIIISVFDGSLILTSY